MTVRARAIGPDEGAPMRGGSHQLKAGVDDTAGALTVWVSRTAHRKGPPLHLHEREDELFYVVAGRYELGCGATNVTAPAGTLTFLPRLTPHLFRSVDELVPGRLLHVAVPGGLERYFAAIGDSDAATEEGRALRRAAGDRFGLRFPDDPMSKWPGAEHEPPFVALDAPRVPRPAAGESELLQRLEPGDTAGRVALAELFTAAGGEWSLPASADWRVAYLVAGELDADLEPATETARLVPGSTLVVPPGVPCAVRCGNGPTARLVVVTAPAAQG